MSKPIKDVLNKDEDSSNFSMNELTFISAQPKQEIMKEVFNGTNMGRSAGQKTAPELNPADELAFVSQESPKDDNSEDVGLRKHEINGENLVDELKFVSQQELDKSDNDEKKPHTDHDDQNSGGDLIQSFSDNLAFLSNSTSQQEITKEILNGTNMLGTRSAGQKTEHPADELAFISQDSPKEDEIEDAGSKRNEDNLVVDELKLSIESSISIETKSNGSNGMSTTSNLSTDQKNPSPIKHITALFVFSAIAVLMTFANLRIGLRLFCPYDDELGTFIVMEQVEQCPVRILDEQEDDHCDESEKGEEELFDYVPAPAAKRHEILCRGTFNVLHAVAELLHPSVHYKTTMPQVHTHSPCPPISKRV